ncbi:gag-pol polyprotein [Lasius niger]|uniref:Gag-pol polyprotein n=1 Tax=Lasius niger TaxID=67767 RepID=A0A0J7KAY2_LASNI|nr:gag-pol polyprotein [Lasius niger]
MIVNQFDVSTAYLNAVIEEEIFMEVPRHTEETLEVILQTERKDSEIRKKATRMLDNLRLGDKVCRLNKAFYGLRQTGRCWHQRLNRELSDFGAIQSSSDSCVYYCGQGKDVLLIATYVDNIIVASRNHYEFDKFSIVIYRINSRSETSDQLHTASELNLYKTKREY